MKSRAHDMKIFGEETTSLIPRRRAGAHYGIIAITHVRLPNAEKVIGKLPALAL